jgi:nitrogen fixation/metabolism regulation signal transduction histidine kinase
MALPFRRRIFFILVVMTAVPTVLAVAGWVLSVRRLLPAAGARASTERVAATARALLEGVDTLHLTVHERALLRQHLNEVSESVSLARRAETFLRYYTAGFAVVILLLGVAVLYAAVNLAGHLSRQLSRPIDELVGWTSLIRRHAELPPGSGPSGRGAPEFDALRQALRDLAAALASARERELEAERLRAFREVARRVAHEIKNPLTSMRIAVDQLGRPGGLTAGRSDTAIQVLAAETDRLERLAKEFSEFGRLPEGPQSEVDLVELLTELGRTGVPSDVEVRVSANGGPRTLMGHYEPLRRAFANLYRNAAEAMQGRGVIDVTVTGETGLTGGTGGTGGGLVVAIADHGPGIPADLRQRVFEPYFTTKADGTGLGLALVRITFEAHHGTISVSETPGGGATFAISFLPASTAFDRPRPPSL